MQKNALFSLLCLIISYFPLTAQNANIDTLTVGLNPEPPFIMENGKEKWDGVSVRLWEEIAHQLDKPFQYKEFDLDGLQTALKNNKVDLAITPMAVTSKRLKNFHFTQPFYISDLTVATPKKEKSQLLLLILNFFSFEFMRAIFLLFIVILVFGLLLWLVEKRHNPEMFGSGLKGLWDGIWWSAVTMTTVGYGDKAPQSNPGKIIAMIWMFTAVIIISSFTASITSSLTINTMQSNISSKSDLADVKLGTVKGSSGEAYIQENGWQYEQFNNPNEALSALKKERIRAFIYDAPIINYLVKNQELQDQIEVLPFQLSKQYYAFSLPTNSPLRDKINPVLLDQIKSYEWKALLRQYNLN